VRSTSSMGFPVSDSVSDSLVGDCAVDELVILHTDVFYQSIVSVLHNASCTTVAQVRHTFYKFWWDEELSLLK